MSLAKLKSTTGVVVSAGKMMKTVKVRVTKQEWNRHLRKEFARPAHHLVNDPNESLIEGDVITFVPERHSKNVHHTVHSVIAPFERPLSQRPPLMGAAERNAKKDEKREAKLDRRAARGVSAALAGQIQKETGAASDTSASAGVNAKGVTVEHGRRVRSDGGHDFGKINNEAWSGKQRAMKRMDKAVKQDPDK